MTLAEQYAARRAAHRGVAEVIKRFWQEMPVGPPGMLDEVQRIINAHSNAGAIEDGPLDEKPQHGPGCMCAQCGGTGL